MQDTTFFMTEQTHDFYDYPASPSKIKPRPPPTSKSRKQISPFEEIRPPGKISTIVMSFHGFEYVLIVSFFLYRPWVVQCVTIAPETHLQSDIQHSSLQYKQAQGYNTELCAQRTIYTRGRLLIKTIESTLIMLTLFVIAHTDEK